MHIQRKSLQSGFGILQLLGVVFGLAVLVAVIYLFLPADNQLLNPAPPLAETEPQSSEPQTAEEPDYSVSELQQLKPTADAEPAIQRLADPESESSPATTEASQASENLEAAQQPAAKIMLPTQWQGGGNLNTSDQPVRDALAKLEPTRHLVSWLVDEELIRRFVVLVDNLANGSLPSKQMVLKPPAGELAVKEMGDEYQLLAANYERYGPYLQVIAKLPPEQVIAYYKEFYPLMQQAYAELGYPRRSFHHRLLQAVDRVLETPPPESGEPVLTRPSVMYKYADAGIEQSPAVQKLLIRMGASNTAQLKDVLWRWKQLLVQLDHR